MKAPVSEWFEQQGPLRGGFAASVRASEKITTIKIWREGFSENSVENALRCVADVFQVLQLNGVSPGRLRLVYQNAWLHCERGSDGSCLGVFTMPNAEGYDAAALGRLFKEFKIMSGMKRA